MGDHPGDGGALTVRGGGRADAAYVVALGAIAFSPFGDYAPVMREFLASPEVVSFIAETSGEPVGFALLDRVPGSAGTAGCHGAVWMAISGRLFQFFFGLVQALSKALAKQSTPYHNIVY